MHHLFSGGTKTTELCGISTQKIFQLASGKGHFVKKRENFFVTASWQRVGAPAMIVSTQNACWGDNYVSTRPTGHPDG